MLTASGRHVTTAKYSPKLNTYDIKISSCGAYNSRSPTDPTVYDSSQIGTFDVK